MRKKNIFTMLTAALLLLLTSSCSSEHELEMPGNGLAGEPGTVRFTLGGSTGDAVTRAAAVTKNHTAEEKKVVSLCAVIFKDDGKVGTVEGTDTFHKLEEIPLAGKDMVENSLYEFKVGEPGDYQICFVANPSDQLKGKFTLASSATVAAFKALVEDKDPGDKTNGMLMTSDFHKVKIDRTTTQEPLTVTMTRAMARIDIENLADGVTVTKVEFVNRALKSDLITDVPALKLEHVATKIYDQLTIVGDSKAASADYTYNEKIYSYEQHNTEAQAPNLKISYHTGDNVVKTHIVKFETKDPIVTPLPLKRNNLYTVKLSNSGAGIRFTLTVADWNQGEEFIVTGDEIANGTDVAVGDIMLKDGSIVKAHTLTELQKPDAIGVVAYLFAEGRAGASLNTKLGRKPKGLVMALKNAGTNVKWDTSDPNTGVGSTHDKLATAYAQSYDGYALTQAVLDKKNPTVFAAMDAVSKFTPVAPLSTSGWYMPSLGEWADMLSTDGLGKVEIADVKNNQINGSSTISGAQKTAMANLNKVLNQIGASHVETFSDTPNEYYWTSSESVANGAYHILFNSTGLHFSGSLKSNTFRVRCVLAF